MKIKVFLPDGAVEVDNVNVLISMVKSGVIQETTTIEANGKQAEAREVRELKPVFAEKETEKAKTSDVAKQNATGVSQAQIGLKNVQHLISVYESRRNQASVFSAIALVLISLYAAASALFAISFLGTTVDIHTKAQNSNNYITIFELQHATLHDFNSFTFITAVALWISVFLLRTIAVAVIDQNIDSYRRQEAVLAEKIRNAN